MATWLITGTSSGLGRALAKAALDAGHAVAATARDPDSARDLEDAHPGRAAAIPLDITDAASRAEALRVATERLGPVDVVVNNAGYGYTGAVEESDDHDVQALFATNLFGPVALVRALLPTMRARRSGLVVNVSSIGARLTLPGGGWYSAAKAGLEAVSGSLAKEVNPLGVRVMVVQPGSLHTDFRGRSAQQAPVRIEDYDDVLGRTGRSHLGPQRGDPARAAAAIVAAADAPVPPQLLVLGSDALEGFHAHAEAEAEVVERFEHLTRSTDLAG